MVWKLPLSGRCRRKSAMQVCPLFFVLIFFAPTVRGQSRKQTESLPIDYYRTHRLSPTTHTLGAALLASGTLPSTLTLTAKVEEHTVGTSGTYAIDLSQSDGVVNDRIILRNDGSADIVNPWVVINNKRNWFDLHSIAAEAVRTETDPEKRAFRLWRFMRDNRYHWYPAESSSEVRDPVRLLNIYGYGFCDDSADVLTALYLEAGFSDARAWGLGGHIVPEVFYSGAWHMFDPDLMVFYPKQDNLSVAGVYDCMADSALVTRVSGSDIANLYQTYEDNALWPPEWVTGWTMGMTLRPGESLERDWTNWGKYHSLALDPAPPLYGNGRLVYAPPLANPVCRQGMTLTNIELSGESGTTPTLHVASPTSSGVVVIPLKSPYVLVGVGFDVDAALAGVKDWIKLEISLDNSHWTMFSQIPGPYVGARSYKLDNFISTLGKAACYQCWIRLTLNSASALSGGVRSLKTTGEIQCSPLALPTLEAARENTVAVTFATNPGGALTVRHEFETLDGYPPDPLVNLLTPKYVMTDEGEEPVFTWSLDSPVLKGFEVQITRDPEGIELVSPTLWHWCGTRTSYTADGNFLLLNQTYYCNVRYRDIYGNWRPWSRAQTFKALPPAAVRDWTQYP